MKYAGEEDVDYSRRGTGTLITHKFPSKRLVLSHSIRFSVSVFSNFKDKTCKWANMTSLLCWNERLLVGYK
jgi:hypothetical protein